MKWNPAFWKYRGPDHFCSRIRGPRWGAQQFSTPIVRVASVKEFSKESIITEKTKVDCDVSDGLYTLVDHINDV